MSVPLELVKGGAAELVQLDGDRGTIASDIPSAPGSRLETRIDGRSLRLKVHRCVKEGERFTIEGRFIDLTRDLRQTLESRLTL
ncbi:MAG: hypothetical protein R3B72_47595 [Polyangiaceae bacterium]